MKKVFNSIFVILCVFTLLTPVGAEPWLKDTVLSANLAVGDTSDMLYSRFDKIEGLNEVFAEYQSIVKSKLGFNPDKDIKSIGAIASVQSKKGILLGYIMGAYDKKKLCTMLDTAGSKIQKNEFKGEKIYSFLNKRGSKVTSLYVYNNSTLLFCKKSVLKNIIEGKVKILDTPSSVQNKYSKGLYLWASIKSLQKSPLAKNKKAGKAINFLKGMFEELSLNIADSNFNFSFLCPTKDSANNLSALLKGQLGSLKAMVDNRIEAVKKPKSDKVWLKSAMKYLSSKVALLIAKSVLKTAQIDENGKDIGLSISLPEGLLPGGPVAIAAIGVVAAIAIPNFKKARARAKQKACFANQRVLMGALEMYNMDNEKKPMLEMNIDNIQKLAAEKYLRRAPKCPDWGVYSSTGNVSKDGIVKCSKHGSIKYK